MSAVQDHPTHQQLAAFLWGQLDNVEQAAIESHVAVCAVCCKILGEIPDDTMLGRLREAGKSSGVPVVLSSKAAQLPTELRDHPRYKIERFLGAGGMGLVYQAQHRVMERVVALKIIHRNLFRNKLVVDRFRHEVKAAARLTHPNIVTAFDAEQANETHFLVMEFVDGINLARLVAKRGALSVAHACNYTRQAALGLQHAFENGMVHRDIKPHNMMLTRKGQIKILDFGLARLTGEPAITMDDAGAVPKGKDRPGLTSMGDVIGTPDYMAPEQYRDSRTADIRADIYSLGCTLYYLLTDHAPFGEGSAQTKVFSHRYFQPRPVAELRDDLPAEVAQIVKKMMAKDPGERYQTPAEVAAALLPFAKPGPAFPLDAPTAKEPEPAPAPTKMPNPSTPERSLRADKSNRFLGRCPYCSARVRLPSKALGASVCCPQCANYFTAVPDEDAAAPSPAPAEPTKAEAAGGAATHAGKQSDRSAPRSQAEHGHETVPTQPAPSSDRTPALVVAAIAGLTCMALLLLFVNWPIAVIAGLLIVVAVLVWKMSPM